MVFKKNVYLHFIGDTYTHLFFNLFLAIFLLPVGLVIWGINYLLWRNYKVILEEQKIIIESGLFAKSREVIPLSKIQKIRSISLPFIQTIGSIVLETGNESDIRLSHLNNYNKLYEELEKVTVSKKD